MILTETYNTQRGNTTTIKDYKPVIRKGVQAWNVACEMFYKVLGTSDSEKNILNLYKS